MVIESAGTGLLAARWESAEWLRRTLVLKSEASSRSSRPTLAGETNPGRPQPPPALVTLHDPCNLVRSGGIHRASTFDPCRTVQNFVEMTPNRAENFCCGGGGGQLAMSASSASAIEAGGSRRSRIVAPSGDVVGPATTASIS